MKTQETNKDSEDKLLSRVKHKEAELSNQIQEHMAEYIEDFLLKISKYQIIAC